MRPVLRKRLDSLEQVSAARMAQRRRNDPESKKRLEKLYAYIEGLRNDPEHQKRMDEMPPEELAARVQALRAQLWAKAHGNREAIQ
jgi:hypothetical protein